MTQQKDRTVIVSQEPHRGSENELKLGEGTKAHTAVWELNKSYGKLCETLCLLCGTLCNLKCSDPAKFREPFRILKLFFGVFQMDSAISR